MNRKIDPSTLWLVAIKDKELAGEPYIAFAVVEAATTEMAAKVLYVEEVLQSLAKLGRNRCHAVVLGTESMPFRLNHFYKTSMLQGEDALLAAYIAGANDANDGVKCKRDTFEQWKASR